MKKLIPTTLIILLLITGCSKDNNIEDPKEQKKTPLVEKIRKYRENSTTLEFDFKYNSENKLSHFTFSDTKIWRVSTDKFPNGSFRSWANYFLDKSGKVVDIEIQQNDRSLSKIEYDSKNRVSIILVNEQRVDAQGFPNTNYEPYRKIYLTWSNDDNLLEIKSDFIGHNTTYITEFSDFSTIENTVSYKNLGFDYFGSTAIGDGIIEWAGISLSGASQNIYAGKMLPGKKVTKNAQTGAIGSTYTYTHRVDAKGRLEETDEVATVGTEVYKSKIVYYYKD